MLITLTHRSFLPNRLLCSKSIAGDVYNRRHWCLTGQPSWQNSGSLNWHRYSHRVTFTGQIIITSNTADTETWRELVCFKVIQKKKKQLSLPQFLIWTPVHDTAKLTGCGRTLPIVFQALPWAKQSLAVICINASNNYCQVLAVI